MNKPKATTREQNQPIESTKITIEIPAKIFEFIQTVMKEEPEKWITKAIMQTLILEIDNINNTLIETWGLEPILKDYY